MRTFRAIHSALLLAALAAPLMAQHEGHEQHTPAVPQAAPAPATSDTAVIAAQKPSYPLDRCVISGEPLAGGEMAPVDIVHDGRLVRLCCKGCIKDFKKDPSSNLARIDAAVIATQKPGYPMTVCPITGAPLGADAIDVVHGTRLVRLGGEACRSKFDADPQLVMAKIDAALIEAQLPAYPLATCVVSGKPLGDAPVRYLHGTQLVQFCCKQCVSKFAAAPETYLEALQTAPAKAPSNETKPANGQGKHEGHADHGCSGC